MPSYIDPYEYLSDNMEAIEEGDLKIDTENFSKLVYYD